MHSFFSAVRVHHGDRLPASGAVVLVSNHHSSLVDPVALLATMRRQPRFLAKSVLWELPYLPLRPFLWLAKALPVYRHVDGGGDNSGMFSASHQVLAEGDVVALFAEGVSHNLPGLHDLKTGAARIALGAPTTVSVVPVGLIYDDRATFRSRAMIYLGEPIQVEGRMGGDQDRQAVRALTEQLADALDDVAPSWESWELHNAARMAASLTVADSPERSMGEVLTQLNRAIDDQTPEGQAVLDSMEALELESARLGLEVETVVDRPRNRVDRLGRLSYFKTVVFLLPTLVGRLINLPPHEVIRWLASRQDLNFRATFKILTALVLYPMWWILVGATAAAVMGPSYGLLALVLTPLLGYIAARTYGRLRRFRNRQAVRQSAIGDGGEWELIALRHRVLDATDAVLARPE